MKRLCRLPLRILLPPERGGPTERYCVQRKDICHARRTPRVAVYIPKPVLSAIGYTSVALTGADARSRLRRGAARLLLFFERS